VPEVTTEDAVRFIVDCLKKPRKTSYGDFGYDIYIPITIKLFLIEVKKIPEHNAHPDSGLGLELSPIFFDAAWALCQKGVIRPGVRNLKGQGDSKGVGFSSTGRGKEWIKQIDEVDYLIFEPNRVCELFQSFTGIFGKGFFQRAVEAIKCHSMGSYLASCVMSGGAAESILLALAIEKTKNEEEVLKEYQSANGRQKTINKITGQMKGNLSSHFNSHMAILTYWRDSASHGIETTISEAEAHVAIGRLIRLCSFTRDNWNALAGK